MAEEVHIDTIIDAIRFIRYYDTTSVCRTCCLTSSVMNLTYLYV